MKVWGFGLLASVSVVLVSTARAEDLSFQDYVNKATHCPGVETKEYPNYTTYLCNESTATTVYIITKPNHPAYPGVIVRRIGPQNIETEGHSFVDDDTAFRDWFYHWKN